MDINNAFSERLKAKRIENGFSQNALAGKIGISRSLYNKYERAGIRPSHEILILLAKELKTTIDYLVGNIDTNDPTPPNKKDLPGQPTIEEIIANDTELSEESKQDLLKQLDMLKMRDNLKKYNKDGSSELQSKLN